MRALKIERVRIDSLFFTPHNYSCLDISVTVRQHHIMEAIGYRNLDRSNYFNL